MTKEIQLFKPVFDTNEILSQIRECLDKGWTGIGYKTLEFEEAFKRYTGLPHAHFLNSATSGLHLALEIIKRKYGKSTFVATTPLTFVATNHVINHAGYEPFFIDVDKYLCMRPDWLKNILQTHKDIGAVIFVGLGGNYGGLAEVSVHCRNYNVPLIVDAAHMMGTSIHLKHVGHEADYTVFSFQSVKNLPTADSGMLCCKSYKDDQLARELSWLGISKDTYARTIGGGNWEYNVKDYGYKYHGNSIMAAMALVGLKYLEAGNSIRRQQALEYSRRLSTEKYGRIPMNPYCTPSRHLYQILVPANHRNNIIKYARDNEVQLGVHYKCNTDYPMYTGQAKFVPAARNYSEELISLPIGPHLTEGDIDRVIEVLNAYPF